MSPILRKRTQPTRSAIAPRVAHAANTGRRSATNVGRNQTSQSAVEIVREWSAMESSWLPRAVVLRERRAIGPSITSVNAAMATPIPSQNGPHRRATIHRIGTLTRRAAVSASGTVRRPAPFGGSELPDRWPKTRRTRRLPRGGNARGGPLDVVRHSSHLVGHGLHALHHLAREASRVGDCRLDDGVAAYACVLRRALEMIDAHQELLAGAYVVARHHGGMR